MGDWRAAIWGRRFALRALAAQVLLLCCAAAAGASAAGDAERGKAIFALAGGCGCHSMTEGPLGAGGRELPTPFGTFYGTNITPDAETGIGAWSDTEIIAAIRDGIGRDGAVLSPVMPYYQYAGMADADARDLVAYLRTLAPARRENRTAEVSIPLARLAYRVWRRLYAPAVRAPAAAPTEALARGRYLVDHVSICGDCHTPRTRFGALDERYYLAGAAAGPDGDPVPNITPDAETGLAKWTVEDFVALLQTTMLPDMDNVQGLMAEVIEGCGGGPGYEHAPEADLLAIATYMKTVPPIRRAAGEKRAQ
ncbi:MAG: cytochrome c [Candidatus Binatia bacterium]